MTGIAIFGATGSIGQATLNLATQFPEHFKVHALAAKTSIDILARQIMEVHPRLAVVYDDKNAKALKSLLPSSVTTEILYGDDGYVAAATMAGVDIVVAAIVGAAGLKSTLAAITAGKDVALANKETLVMAGGLVKKAVHDHGVRLLPVDSEHSAIFQCLQGQNRNAIDKIILTASGGPFRNTPAAVFSGITKEQALKHPNWRMGAKITIDSATLMNKGLEVIEAKWLFDVETARIDVLVHPQSIVHSMVAYHDGSIMAQLGIPDMQTAIAYALSFPERLPLKQPLPDLATVGSLTFEKPDMQRFKCLKLAFEACATGGTLPAVMNAANEIAVQAFLDDRLRFSDIPVIIDQAMRAHDTIYNSDLHAIMHADAWARRIATRKIDALSGI